MTRIENPRLTSTATGPQTTPRSRALDPSQPEIIPSYTVVFGANSDRRAWNASAAQEEASAREKHLEYLREVLPK